MHKSGIYKILNKITGKFYIGSTKDFRIRWAEHLRRLRKNEHNNNYLQHSWNKYGEKNFKFLIIEVVEDVNSLIEKEQLWLDKTKAFNRENGYNICSRAGNTLGVKMPKHVKKMLTEINIGRDPWNKGVEFVKKKEDHKRSKKNRNKISETLRKKMSGSMTKLDWEKVREIRRRFKEEGIHKAELARIYEVDRSQISRIINNQTWREVSDSK